MTLISIVSGIGTCIFTFYKIKSKRPELLKLAKITTIDNNNEITTYNWNLIQSIFIRCIAFGSAVFILSNAVIFVILETWYVDSRSVGVLAIVFGVFVFKEFDKFVTGIIRP